MYIKGLKFITFVMNPISQLGSFFFLLCLEYMFYNIFLNINNINIKMENMNTIKKLVKSHFIWWSEHVGYMNCYPPTGMIPMNKIEQDK